MRIEPSAPNPDDNSDSLDTSLPLRLKLWLQSQRVTVSQREKALLLTGCQQLSESSSLIWNGFAELTRHIRVASAVHIMHRYGSWYVFTLAQLPFPRKHRSFFCWSCCAIKQDKKMKTETGNGLYLLTEAIERKRTPLWSYILTSRLVSLIFSPDEKLLSWWNSFHMCLMSELLFHTHLYFGVTKSQEGWPFWPGQLWSGTTPSPRVLWTDERWEGFYF